MFNIHTEAQRQIEQQRKKITEERQAYITSPRYVKRRDHLAKAYQKRVDDWMASTHNKTITSGPPQPPRRNLDTNAHMMRRRVPGKELGSARMLYKPTEKERVAEADRILSARPVMPYADPVGYPLRDRIKHKEIAGPIRYTARSERERVQATVAGHRLGQHSPGSTFHNFRDYQPQLWKGGQFATHHPPADKQHPVFPMGRLSPAAPPPRRVHFYPPQVSNEQFSSTVEQDRWMPAPPHRRQLQGPGAGGPLTSRRGQMPQEDDRTHWKMALRVAQGTEPDATRQRATNPDYAQQKTIARQLCQANYH